MLGVNGDLVVVVEEVAGVIVGLETPGDFVLGV
jgi:hypothetical protein